MKLKIVSDGTAAGTFLVNSETGEKVEDVAGLTWECSAHKIPNATITLFRPEVNVVGEVVEP